MKTIEAKNNEGVGNPMANQSEVIGRISERLRVAEQFAEYLMLGGDSPEYCMLLEEAQSARKWLSSIGQRPQHEYVEETAAIVALLKRCAELTRDHFNFLAWDFETAAADASRLGAEFAGMEGTIEQG